MFPYLCSTDFFADHSALWVKTVRSSTSDDEPLCSGAFVMLTRAALPLQVEQIGAYRLFSKFVPLWKTFVQKDTDQQYVK